MLKAQAPVVVVHKATAVQTPLPTRKSALPEAFRIIQALEPQSAPPVPKVSIKPKKARQPASNVQLAISVIYNTFLKTLRLLQIDFLFYL